MDKIIYVTDVQNALSEMLKARCPKGSKPCHNAHTNDANDTHNQKGSQRETDRLSLVRRVAASMKYQDAVPESAQDMQMRQAPKFLQGERQEQAEFTEEDD